MNEHEKEQALKLSALYKELADKGTYFQYDDCKVSWVNVKSAPHLFSTLSRWRVAEPMGNEE